MSTDAQSVEMPNGELQVSVELDWQRIASMLLASRCMDDLEETRLVPRKKILYQFSARGHDLAQVILGSMLTHKRDAVAGYYRSRPLMLTLA